MNTQIQAMGPIATIPTSTAVDNDSEEYRKATNNILKSKPYTGVSCAYKQISETKKNIDNKKNQR